jgi:hypothetical protein
MSDRAAWAQWIKTRTADGVKVSTRPSTNKYQAHAVRVDGILFDSQREAARYQELKLRQLAGEISQLEVHPGFALIVPQLSGDELPVTVFQTVGMFHADFKYRDHRTHTWIVEDVKSAPTKTEAYKLRKKIVEAVHGITITEIA